MLINVLTRLAADTGYHITQKRVTLIDLLYKSGKEIHQQLEANKMFREVTLVVPTNKVVSLPSFVGDLKGMRIHTNDIPFSLFGVGSPRYIKHTDDYKFRNWRDLGDSPIHTLPTNVGFINFSTNVVEDSVLMISGQTDKAEMIEEEVTLDSASVNTTNLFGPRIDSIACVSQDRTSDITIKDDTGTELAILYNNAYKTRYKLIDVSELFFPIDTSLEESLIDICYKLPYRMLTRDSDSLISGDDFDEAWYNMAMFMHLSPVPDKAADALRHYAAATAFMKSGKASGDNTIVKKVSWGMSKFYGLFDRYHNCNDPCTRE
jgi:hypothetical protein